VGSSGSSCSCRLSAASEGYARSTMHTLACFQYPGGQLPRTFLVALQYPNSGLCPSTHTCGRVWWQGEPKKEECDTFVWLASEGRGWGLPPAGRHLANKAAHGMSWPSISACAALPCVALPHPALPPICPSLEQVNSNEGQPTWSAKSTLSEKSPSARTCTHTHAAGFYGLGIGSCNHPQCT